MRLRKHKGEIQVLDAVDDPYLLKVPDSMPWKNALCFDPAQLPFGGIRDGHVRLGDRVAVFGLGAIGAIASQMAKVAGAAYVAVIDPIEKRRHAALDAGADAALIRYVRTWGSSSRELRAEWASM